MHSVIARLGDAGTTLLEVHTDRQRTAETRIHTQPDMPPVLDRALHSERLTLRPAVLSDAEATWTFRQLSVVNEWLTGCPADNASYRELCGDPSAWLRPWSSPARRGSGRPRHRRLHAQADDPGPLMIAKLDIHS